VTLRPHDTGLPHPIRQDPRSPHERRLPYYCATDLNNHTGYRSAAQGAAIAVRLATLGPDGPTGGFFNDEGPVPW
jgi:hypothetical protein